MSFKQLYPYQEKYLEGVPSRYIFSADLGCFAGDTPVATPEGYRRIDAIRKGDLVFSYTDDGKIITAKVDAVQETSNKPKPMIQFIYGNTKTTIRATYDHPFFDGERYYPLYQLIWGSLEASQRLQLELLCKQYGQVIDYTPSWGIKGSDNEAWERPNRTPADSYEWQNYKSPQSSCSNLDTKSKQFTVHQSQRLQPKEQQNREPRMVYTETEQPTRIQKRTTLSVARKSETEQSKIFNHTPRNAAPDMANMGTKSQSKSIHSIIGDISTVQQKRTKKHSTRAIEIQSVEILPTQTYYALSIAGKWHTYIVANLPVHNTGKTPLAIVHYIRKAYPQPLLILAPASKVRAGDWERELAEVFAAHNLALPEYQILSYDKFAYNPSNDAFRAGKRPKWHEFAPDYGGREWAIIADEVQYCKAPSSNRSKALYHVAKNASFFVGLSGTPMPNGWIDFANYSKIFGFTKGITEFKKKYCDIQTYKGFPEIVGYWRIPDLEKQWRSVAKPLSREQATELPERTFYNIKLKAPRIYFEYLIDRKTELGVLLDNPSKLAHALRQSLAKNKLERLDEILSSTSDNVVIFYNYELELQLIKEMIAKKHKDKILFEQNGHKHEIPPKEAWERVSNSVTLAHYKSGATGVEMQYANVTVYYSPTYSYAEYEQSKGRTHRNGQTKKCVYYRFYSVGTIEKNIWECIAQKKDFSEKLWIKNTIDNNNDI